MVRNTINGVSVYTFSPSWWHVTYSNELLEWVVVEVHELPEMEDLSHFLAVQEDAIKLARQENSDLRKKRANGETFTV